MHIADELIILEILIIVKVRYVLSAKNSTYHLNDEKTLIM